jgi:hypothetical protein
MALRRDRRRIVAASATLPAGALVFFAAVAGPASAAAGPASAATGTALASVHACRLGKPLCGLLGAGKGVPGAPPRSSTGRAPGHRHRPKPANSRVPRSRRHGTVSHLVNPPAPPTDASPDTPAPPTDLSPDVPAPPTGASPDTSTPTTHTSPDTPAPPTDTSPGAPTPSGALSPDTSTPTGDAGSGVAAPGSSPAYTSAGTRDPVVTTGSPASSGARTVGT